MESLQYLGQQLLRVKAIPSYDLRFSGFSEGWLVTIDRSFALTLYKPFMVSEGKTDAIIHLPPLFPPIDQEREDATDELFLERHVYKLTTFTPDPINNPKDLICVVSYGEFNELAYIRPAHDASWNRVTGMERVLFDDVIYYKEKFYALTYEGKLTSFDVAQSFKSNIKLVIDTNEIRSIEGGLCYKRYLIKSQGGELLQVQRYADWDDDLNRVTRKFKVFKLSCDQTKWVEIKSLGDVALFLGDNSSMSVNASSFDGCQGNCIYFTHDKDTLPLGTHGPSDMGVYDLKSQCVTSFAIDAEILASMRSAPIWVVP